MSLVLLAGLGLAGASTLLPVLSERVTDRMRFTIKLRKVEVPEVSIVSIHYPSELEAGDVPRVTVTVRHNRSRWEYIFVRIRDLDTGKLVTRMKKKYVYAEKNYVFTFEDALVAEDGDWYMPMPNRDWRLQVEAGLWWWP